MAFSEETIKQAFQASRDDPKSEYGRCECRRKSHDWHGARCPVTFTYDDQGDKWEAHHRISVDADGSDTIVNCEILCIRCHDAVHA